MHSPSRNSSSSHSSSSNWGQGGEDSGNSGTSQNALPLNWWEKKAGGKWTYDDLKQNLDFTPAQKKYHFHKWNPIDDKLIEETIKKFMENTLDPEECRQKMQFFFDTQPGLYYPPVTEISPRKFGYNSPRKSKEEAADLPRIVACGGPNGFVKATQPTCGGLGFLENSPESGYFPEMENARTIIKYYFSISTFISLNSTNSFPPLHRLFLLPFVQLRSLSSTTTGWCVIYKPPNWVCDNMISDRIRDFKPNFGCVGSLPLWIVAKLGTIIIFI